MAVGLSSAPCAATMRHRLSAASLRLQGSAQGRSSPSVRRSPRPSWRDQRRAGLAPERSAEGHAFFSRRFASAMRRGLSPAVTTPCSSPGLGPLCMSMVSPQPGSIVTVFVSVVVRERYDRILRFRSKLFLAVRERLRAGLRPTGPVVHRSLCVCYGTWRQAVRAPGRCGSLGSSPVCGPCFPCMRKARHWSRSASLAPRATAHHARVR